MTMVDKTVHSSRPSVTSKITLQEKNLNYSFIIQFLRRQKSDKMQNAKNCATLEKEEAQMKF